MNEAAKRYRERTVQRALSVPGVTTAAARRAAFDNAGVDERARRLVDTVAKNAWKVTSDDVASTKAAGVSEDEIFELTVCAALGQATRQIDAALTVLDVAIAATAEEEKVG
jgi:hypothetical protein